MNVCVRNGSCQLATFSPGSYVLPSIPHKFENGILNLLANKSILWHGSPQKSVYMTSSSLSPLPPFLLFPLLPSSFFLFVFHLSPFLSLFLPSLHLSSLLPRLLTAVPSSAKGTYREERGDSRHGYPGLFCHEVSRGQRFYPQRSGEHRQADRWIPSAWTVNQKSVLRLLTRLKPGSVYSFV